MKFSNGNSKVKKKNIFEAIWSDEHWAIEVIVSIISHSQMMWDVVWSLPNYVRGKQNKSQIDLTGKALDNDPPQKIQWNIPKILTY